MLPQRKVSDSHSCIVKLVFLWEYYIFLNFLRHLDVISFFLISSYLVFLYRHILFSHTFIYFFYYTHTFFEISSYVVFLYLHIFMSYTLIQFWDYLHVLFSYTLIHFLLIPWYNFYLIPWYAFFYSLAYALIPFSTYQFMLSF